MPRLRAPAGAFGQPARHAALAGLQRLPPQGAHRATGAARDQAAQAPQHPKGGDMSTKSTTWRARAAASLRQFAQPFLLGGPVGVYYTLRLAWLRRRAAKVSAWMHQENEVHREHVRALNHELNEV